MPIGSQDEMHFNPTVCPPAQGSVLLLLQARYLSVVVRAVLGILGRCCCRISLLLPALGVDRGSMMSSG